LFREVADMDGKTPIYAYPLALLGGGVAMFTFLDAPVFALYLAYAVLGALFGALWPGTSWRWGVWLAVPIVGTVVTGVMSEGTLRTVDLLVMIGVPVFAGAGGYAGAQRRARKRAEEVQGA
jgi:hypothetical protein